MKIGNDVQVKGEQWPFWLSLVQIEFNETWKTNWDVNFYNQFVCLFCFFTMATSHFTQDSSKNVPETKKFTGTSVHTRRDLLLFHSTPHPPPPLHNEHSAMAFSHRRSTSDQISESISAMATYALSHNCQCAPPPSIHRFLIKTAPSSQRANFQLEWDESHWPMMMRKKRRKTGVDDQLFIVNQNNRIANFASKSDAISNDVSQGSDSIRIHSEIHIFIPITRHLDGTNLFVFFFINFLNKQNTAQFFFFQTTPFPTKINKKLKIKKRHKNRHGGKKCWSDRFELRHVDDCGRK